MSKTGKQVCQSIFNFGSGFGKDYVRICWLQLSSERIILQNVLSVCLQNGKCDLFQLSVPNCLSFSGISAWTGDPFPRASIFHLNVEICLCFLALLHEQVQLFTEHSILARYKAKYLQKKVFKDEKGGNSILGKIFDLAQVTPQAIGERSQMDVVIATVPCPCSLQFGLLRLDINPLAEKKWRGLYRGRRNWYGFPCPGVGKVHQVLDKTIWHLSYRNETSIGRKRSRWTGSNQKEV